MTVQALINPKIVQWARERRTWDIHEAGSKLKLDADTLLAWETGESRPTFRQAQGLAQKFNIPFGYLYLSTPPQQTVPLPDLRTTGGTPPPKPSPEFLDLLYDVLRKQQWYHEYLESEGARAVPFVGRFSRGEDPGIVAADIRRELGIDDGLRERVASSEQFLTEFIRTAEEAHVLVLRSGIVGGNTTRHLAVEEFRGFSISDSLAPLVFINSNDAGAARIFTLAHELAHIWMGESGISDPDYGLRSFGQQNAVESQCNTVAAEVLVPKTDFAMRWDDFKDVDHNLRTLSAHYRVSRFVILRRSYEVGKIPVETYAARYAEMLRPHPAGHGKESKGNFYTTLLSRNGASLTRALIAATAEGRVSPREAARLLNVRIGKLTRIENRLWGSTV
ncbi:MAG: ImmA/IrrE family metallo-endopeptidase [Chloroflexi bacterium]|nr:ImmA/IrrE family metallo-endopeptidase [Chloroflexota bacterium]